MEHINEKGPPEGPVSEWRARLGLSAFANLPADFKLASFASRSQLVSSHLTGEVEQLVDVSLPRMSLEEAWFLAYDLANTLADAVSLLSFAPASAGIVSVSPAVVHLNQEFDIAIPVECFRRTTVALDTAKLETLCAERERAVEIAMRKFRTGLRAGWYQLIVDLWTAIETIAGFHAKKNGDFLTRQCQASCKEVWTSGDLRTMGYIADYFERTKAAEKPEDEAPKEAKRTRGLRGSIVHGGTRHNSKLRKKVEASQSWLQSASALAILETLGLKSDGNHCLHLGIPYTHLKMSIIDAGGQVSFRPAITAVPCSFSKLPESHAEKRADEFMFGYFEDQVKAALNPFILPDLIPAPTH